MQAKGYASVGDMHFEDFFKSQISCRSYALLSLLLRQTLATGMITRSVGIKVCSMFLLRLNQLPSALSIIYLITVSDHISRGV